MEVAVEVSERQRAILEKWVRNRADTPTRFVERRWIILMSAEGVSNTEQLVGHSLPGRYFRARMGERG